MIVRIMYYVVNHMICTVATSHDPNGKKSLGERARIIFRARTRASVRRVRAVSQGYVRFTRRLGSKTIREQTNAFPCTWRDHACRRCRCQCVVLFTVHFICAYTHATRQSRSPSQRMAPCVRAAADRRHDVSISVGAVRGATPVVNNARRGRG